MATISPGIHTFAEVFETAGFNFAEEAAVDYNDDGVDHRRVTVGGLSFDSVDQEFNVPESAEEVVISLDGEAVVSLDVE